MLKNLFEQQQKHLDHFFSNIDVDVANKLLDSMTNCSGVIFFSGIGKSGLIAKKISDTMTSTGTKSLFLSPTNALHGDIGIVSKDDLFVFLSKSGESEELLNLIPFLRNRGVQLAALVSNGQSRLAKNCDYSVVLPLTKELCPLGLSPTTSSAIQLIFGDILATALMERKSFAMDQYRLNHPAGRIGKRMTLKVKDLMLSGDQLPLCNLQDQLVNVLVELSYKRCGCLLVTNEENALLGIFTDGDLRRALQEHGPAALQLHIESIMTTSPRWIEPDLLAYDAMLEMEKNQQKPVTVLPVLDHGKKIVGLIKMHDLLQSGL